MIKIGTNVRVIKSGDGPCVGEVGIVLEADSRSNRIGVYFPNWDYGHGLDGKSPSGTGGWRLNIDRLEILKGKKIRMDNPRRKCASCQNVLLVGSMTKSSNGRYVCRDCLQVKQYSTASTQQAHRQKDHHKTYGFEFECIPINKQAQATIMANKYGFIPTSDCSLATGGIEFKTPIYYSLNGVKPMLRTLLTLADFQNDSCGQHINMGDTKHIDPSSMSKIRDYAFDLFDPLYNYMYEHRSQTTRVCGRFFTNYARQRSCYTDHVSWINLSHDYRIEFRLSKMNSANQYFQLICMWTEILDCVINGFLLKYQDRQADVNKTNAHRVGERLVKIFQKYADGKSICQRAERNKLSA
jgi:hypothetical protein